MVVLRRRGGDGEEIVLLAWSEDIPGRGRFNPPRAAASIRDNDDDDDDDDDDEEEEEEKNGASFLTIDAKDIAALFPTAKLDELLSSSSASASSKKNEQKKKRKHSTSDDEVVSAAPVLFLLYDPFRPCDEEKPRPLRDVMRAIKGDADGDVGDGDALAVSPDITNCPERTIYAERYELVEGGSSWRQRPSPSLRAWRQTTPPTRRDLLAMLRDEGVRVRLADDLDAAEKQQSRGQQLQHRRRQSTNRILMVAPSAFEANIQAAADNYFLAGTDTVADSDDAARRRVLREYAGLVRVLSRDVGVEAGGASAHQAELGLTRVYRARKSSSIFRQ